MVEATCTNFSHVNTNSALPSKPSTVQFPTGPLHCVGCIRRAQYADGQDSCFKILKRKALDALGQVMGHLGFKTGERSFFQHTELYSHSQQSLGWPSLHLDSRPFIQVVTVL